MAKSLVDLYHFIIFDCEVFAHDWLVVFKNGKRWDHFWNDPLALREYFEKHKDAVFVGFNNKHYDNYIILGILAGLIPEEVKDINDFIIETGEPGWRHPDLRGCSVDFNYTDLKDDMDKGLSLKAIEGHLGLPIRESSVPFDYPDPLDDARKEEVLRYCKYDVESTEKLFELRKDYIETKLVLAKLGGIEPMQALGMTDPKLAAAYMGAKAQEFDDEREYEFPAKRINIDSIPDDIRKFFKTIYDKSIPDDDLWKTKLETEIGGCPVTLAWGGIHGALPKYREQATRDRLILNYDVSSLYPSLMIEYGYVSRAVPDPAIFKEIRDDRFEAKAKGDKKTANALKSPLNKTYGAMLNQYNPMYDPLMARSVCISGQLSMVYLSEMLLENIYDVRIIQLNTDGIMISIPAEEKDGVLEVIKRWQEYTHLQLEEDQIDLIWQKDVNNYALRKKDGSIKVKGGYLSRGINPIGAWSINEQAVIVAQAIQNYLIDGITPETTINGCTNVEKFQLIAKAGIKYSKVYQEFFVQIPPESDGPPDEFVDRIELQKCNRVFASDDESLGRLYKVKAADGSVAKIENLPDHCLVCNEEMPSIEEIDKQWYIDLAWRRIHDFEPEEEKDMPRTKTETEIETKTETKTVNNKVSDKDNYSKLNVYQKLAIARRMFLEAAPKKSGKNSHLEFKYFELDDIVPVQTRIFAQLGLLEKFTCEPLPSEVINDEHEYHQRDELFAFSTVINTDNPNDQTSFKLPWKELEPIVSSKTGTNVTNPIQSMGMVQTYLRRYLKMQILDICEADEIDGAPKPKERKTRAKSATKSTPEPKEEEAPKKPATTSERKAAASSVTKRGKATAQQVTTLREAIKAMKNEYGDKPEVSNYIAEIGIETERLTKVTKAQCEEIIRKLGEMKEKLEGSENK